MKKKLVYVDIGTHMGQEFKALFVYSIWQFLYRFTKLFLASFILRKNKIIPVRLTEAIDIIRHTRQIREAEKKYHYCLS